MLVDKKIEKLADEIYQKTDKCGVCISYKEWRFRSGNKSTEYSLSILPEGEEVDIKTFQTIDDLEKYIGGYNGRSG